MAEMNRGFSMSYKADVRQLPRDSSNHSESSAIMFDLVLRGYDRRQVDDYLAALSNQLAELREARQREQRRAEKAETDLRASQWQVVELQQAPPPPVVTEDPAAGHGFGYRAEKLLRAVEAEAAEVRSNAAREVTALLERAREDAEAHRHKAEQQLINRRVALDQEAAQHAVELDAHLRDIAAQAESAREESEKMVAHAREQSDQLRKQAQARVEHDRLMAENVIRERHVTAERELARLGGLHADVRAQLARMLDALAAEFGGPSGSRAAQRSSRGGQSEEARRRDQPRAYPDGGGTALAGEKTSVLEPHSRVEGPAGETLTAEA
jgi:cell division septum initiation protein DivIVA